MLVGNQRANCLRKIEGFLRGKKPLKVGDMVFSCLTWKTPAGSGFDGSPMIWDGEKWMPHYKDTAKRYPSGFATVADYIATWHQDYSVFRALVKGALGDQATQAEVLGGTLLDGIPSEAGWWARSGADYDPIELIEYLKN